MRQDYTQETHKKHREVLYEAFEGRVRALLTESGLNPELARKYIDQVYSAKVRELVINTQKAGNPALVSHVPQLAINSVRTQFLGETDPVLREDIEREFTDQNPASLDSKVKRTPIA